MALTIGSGAADTGMSKAIFDQLDTLLAPPLQAVVDAADAAGKPAAQATLAAARDGWRHLAFAIATGVVNHLLGNLEVTGVSAGGAVTVAALNVPAPVTVAQNNNGTGLVR
jgi:hypothetical protein